MALAWWTSTASVLVPLTSSDAGKHQSKKWLSASVSAVDDAGVEKSAAGAQSLTYLAVVNGTAGGL